MPAPRSTSVRGTRTPPAARAPRPRPEEFEAEEVEDPTRPRDVVSFALARRAALETLRRGATLDNPCDADPGLLRAARFHGEQTTRDCPVCGRVRLVEVTWVYGAQLGATSGSAVSQERLTSMAHEVGRFRVYVVEVCRQCSWNHVVTAFTLGDGVARTAARHRASRTR